MAEEILYRTGTIHRDVVDEEARTIELSFSSTTPMERMFGNEVLEHSEDAVDLHRLNTGAPLLLEHDRSQQVGVVERAWVDEGCRKRSHLGETISNTGYGIPVSCNSLDTAVFQRTFGEQCQ